MSERRPHFTQILQTISNRGSACLRPEIFLFLLDKELARAERYNSFVSLLLFKITGAEKLSASVLARLVHVLEANTRRSDHVGIIEDGVLGVILPYAGEKGAWTALQRLTSEVLFCVSDAPEGVSLGSAYAVCPSEANSLESLLNLALGRCAAGIKPTA